jgi:hypothetical protein
MKLFKNLGRFSLSAGIAGVGVGIGVESELILLIGEIATLVGVVGEVAVRIIEALRKPM